MAVILDGGDVGVVVVVVVVVSNAEVATGRAGNGENRFPIHAHHRP